MVSCSLSPIVSTGFCAYLGKSTKNVGQVFSECGQHPCLRACLGKLALKITDCLGLTLKLLLYQLAVGRPRNSNLY